MASIIDAQRNIILETIRQATRGDWKVLILDPDSRRLIDNVIQQDEILNENITHIEQILDRRPTNRETDALYILTPQPHIVDCLMADFEKRKYKRAHLVWTSRGSYPARQLLDNIKEDHVLTEEAVLHPALRDRIDKSPTAREQIALFRVLNVEFFPRESHMVTFRDPYSFPILFHPGCNSHVRQHMEDIAQKIVGVCVALGEYPVIRYYRPRTPTHEASILCSHLARFVQDELDLYAKFHEDFPPQTSRPRGTLFVTDRSMDLYAPFLHEFTYQAMAHDLLPIKEGDKITYRTVINEGGQDREIKDIEISEKDKIWTENRHRHMKDTIDKLMSDFQRFIKDNPNFTKNAEGGANSLNAIKDMMAGLPQFQSMKEAYALHLGMAQESMNRFQSFKLAELASIEQMLATGLDEDYKKPKGVADQVIRMLDEEGIQPFDKLRLLTLFMLYNDAILPSDLEMLTAFAQLQPQDANMMPNLSVLGANTTRALKDKRPKPQPLFAPKPPPITPQDEYALSRYEPALQIMLEQAAAGQLDAQTFPYTKPPLEMGNEAAQVSATSLRSAKPTWAKTRAGNVGSENRQRVIVFMAGGATYSESRVCYQMGAAASREVYLVTSHMLTPSLFIRQVGDLSVDKRALRLPVDQPKPQAPAHLFEPEPQPKPPPQAPQPVQQRAPAPPTQQMGAMNLNETNGAPSGPRPMQGGRVAPPPVQANSSAKLTKEPKEEKKKRHLFGRKKD